MVVILNAADLLSTYLASPDLSREWNVLHRELNLGWAGLVGAKVLGGWLAVAGFRHYLRHRDRCYPVPGLAPLEFCHYFMFGDEGAARSRRVGGVAPRALVVLGFLWAGMQTVLLWVTADNLLLHYGVVLRTGAYDEWAYHTMQSVTVALAVLAVMFRVNFRRYVALGARAAAA
jgi:hypothetical protein